MTSRLRPIRPARCSSRSGRTATPRSTSPPLSCCSSWSARSPAGAAIPLIVGATAARLLHAYGMLTADSLASETKGRLVGAIGTYAFGFALAVTLVVSLW